MDRIKMTIILILTCVIIVGTTCLAATGIVNAPSGLVLRETPDKNSEPITTISDETKVEIIEKNGEWYKVKYGEYEGYLFAEYVNVDEEVKAEETKTEEQTVEETKQEETATTEEKQTTVASFVKNFPQNVKTTDETKAYFIPSISSRIALNLEKDKEIALNYELNNWYNISFEGKTYWIRKASIKIEEEEATTSTSEEPAYESRTGYINVSSSANVRESANTSANVLTSLTTNAEVTVVGEEGDFYKIQYQEITGYVSKSLVSDKKVEVTSRSNNGERRQATATTETASQPAVETVSATPASEVSGVGGEKIANFAKQYVGYSYTYGGTTPSGGFDCSGFAQYVCRECGYSIGRTCSNQLNNGTTVSRDELQVGDLIFFNNTSNGSVGHVGIYIGGGSIVHAANSRRGVTIDTISSGYYNNYYMTARRIAN